MHHQITSSWIDPYGNNRLTTLGITRSNIAFLGKGEDTITILGGFGIYEQENITFKNMTVGYIEVFNRPEEFSPNRPCESPQLVVDLNPNFRTSNQARGPAEFKHITKRRKRN